MQEALPGERPLRKLLYKVVLNVVLPRFGSRLDQDARERVRVRRRRSVPRYQCLGHSMSTWYSRRDYALGQCVEMVERPMSLSYGERGFNANVCKRSSLACRIHHYKL